MLCADGNSTYWRPPTTTFFLLRRATSRRRKSTDFKWPVLARRGATLTVQPFFRTQCDTVALENPVISPISRVVSEKRFFSAAKRRIIRITASEIEFRVIFWPKSHLQITFLALFGGPPYASSATPPMRQREEKQRLAIFGKDVWKLQEKCMNFCQDSKRYVCSLCDRHVSMSDWPVRRKDLSISSVVYRILPEIYVFGTSYLDLFRFW